mmetsp:Transcript_127873/g.355855  ORF Transcript_127873/g.355855 Transcript_127873/m.355855 type:complete len:336 (+) Transcript_127873:1508-2515(+)
MNIAVTVIMASHVRIGMPPKSPSVAGGNAVAGDRARKPCWLTSSTCARASPCTEESAAAGPAPAATLLGSGLSVVGDSVVRGFRAASPAFLPTALPISAEEYIVLLPTAEPWTWAAMDVVAAAPACGAWGGAVRGPTPSPRSDGPFVRSSSGGLRGAAEAATTGAPRPALLLVLGGEFMATRLRPCRFCAGQSCALLWPFASSPSCKVPTGSPMTSTSVIWSPTHSPQPLSAGGSATHSTATAVATSLMEKTKRISAPSLKDEASTATSCSHLFSGATADSDRSPVMGLPSSMLPCSVDLSMSPLLIHVVTTSFRRCGPLVLLLPLRAATQKMIT